MSSFWREKYEAVQTAALVIHAIFSVVAIGAIPYGFIIMKSTGRFEADQIVDVFLIGGWFIVYPLAAVMAICSLFNWRTIILLLLMFVFLNSVSDNVHTSAANIAAALAYPFATLCVWILKIRNDSKRRSTQT